MKQVKTICRNLIKEIKKKPINAIIFIASIIALIIGSITIGFIKSFIIVLILNIIAYIPNINAKKRRINRKLKEYNKKHPKDNTINTPRHAASRKKAKMLSEEKPKKKKMGKLKKTIIIIFIAGFGITILAIVLFAVFIVITSPKFDPKELYVNEPSIVYDNKGEKIYTLGTENRIILEYNELPEVLVDAIVATEDSKFFQHGGVDWLRFSKASFQQLLGHSYAGGASTLTMQVSKNTYTSAEASGIKGIIRKFQDVYISAFKIEPNYSKKEIMEFYVNSYFLGNNAYGVEQASLTYFNKSAKDLNLAEAAMIAGLFQAPGKYNPYKNPDVTEKRRQLVLKLMLRHGYINKKEYEVAKKMTVEKIVKPRPEGSEGGISEYQSFIDVVVDEIEEKTGDSPYTTGMEIYTTLDTEKQKYVNDIMNGVTYDWENDDVQAGIAVTDINSGAIVAVGGGRNVNAAATFNHATMLKRQIGSTAKPCYDYGPAIEYLHWSTEQILVDEAITYSDGTPINNWNGQYEGMETMRVALTRSRNIPALKAFQANDKSNIIKFVKGLGLSPEEKDGFIHEAHAIGGYNGESPLSMAAAYASFGNGGNYIAPYSYSKLVYVATGDEIDNVSKPKKAMSDSTAYMISDMLVDTGQYALGRWANINGKTYAAKTGTTNFDDATKRAFHLPGNAVNDLWTVGFNNEYAIGVWYGYDKTNSKHYNLLSSGQHEKLFQAVGRGMFTSSGGFKRPGSVVEVGIEAETPEPALPCEYTPGDLIKTALFVKGFEPKETSARFAKLSNPTGLTATSSGNTVTLTWSQAPTPEINTDAFLRKYYENTFKTSTLNSYIAGRLGYINSTMGGFGYYIYRQDGDSLTQLGFTTNTNFTLQENTAGNHTYVVKTSYAAFTANQSDGINVKINSEGEKKKEEKKCPSGYILVDGICEQEKKPDDDKEDKDDECSSGVYDSEGKCID